MIGRKQNLTAYVLLAPLIILFGSFSVYPFLYGIYISLFRWDGLTTKTFIGLNNYIRALKDTNLHSAFLHNIVYTAGTVIGKITLSFSLALFMQQNFKGRTFFRVVFFVPVVLAMTTVSVLWLRIYDPVLGLINTFFLGIKLIKEPILWLGEPRLALWSLMIVDLWKWTGYHMVIFLAGLTTIPDELYESASMDGANYMQKLFFITIPQMKNITVMNLTVMLMGGFSVFDIVYIMTKGGPYKSTDVILTYMYDQTFGGMNSNYGFGCTIAMLLFLIILVITLIMTKVISRED